MDLYKVIKNFIIPLDFLSFVSFVWVVVKNLRNAGYCRLPTHLSPRRGVCPHTDPEELGAVEALLSRPQLTVGKAFTELASSVAMGW